MSSDVTDAAATVDDATTGDTTETLVADTAHPCGSCGEPVPAHQEFCMQCGAHQPAVAEAESPADSPPIVVSAQDLAAMEAEATGLVGTSVVFRSIARRDRVVRSEPDPEAPTIGTYLLGRSTIVEARGAWVLLQHSTGIRGWCLVTKVKSRESPDRVTEGAPRRRAPRTADALSMVEALERLHALHQSGGLTDDEFTHAKKALLGGA